MYTKVQNLIIAYLHNVNNLKYFYFFGLINKIYTLLKKTYKLSAF